MRQVTKGSTDVSEVIRIVDSTDGTPETGVVFNTAGIDLWYRREGAAKTSITEATLSALTDAHSDGGFLHIGDGYYRLDLPDAAVAAGTASTVSIGGTVTGMVVIGTRLQLNDGGRDGIIASGTLQSATNTTAVLAAATSIADNLVNGAVLFIYEGTGAGQSRGMDGWVSATDTATVSPAWTTNPDSTSKYHVFASPPASTSSFPGVNVEQINGVTLAGDGNGTPMGAA
jgi:hypothetical protein